MKRNRTTLPFHTKLYSISCFGRREKYNAGSGRAGNSNKLSDAGRARAYILGPCRALVADHLSSSLQCVADHFLRPGGSLSQEAAMCFFFLTAPTYCLVTPSRTI